MAVTDTFNTRGNKTNLTRIQRIDILHFRRKDTNLINRINRIIRHHTDLLLFANNAVFNSHQNDNPQIGVIPTINQQRLKGFSFISLWGRQIIYNSFQNIFHPKTGFARCLHRMRCVQTNHILNLFFNFFRVGRGQINFI